MIEFSELQHMKNATEEEVLNQIEQCYESFRYFERQLTTNWGGSEEGKLCAARDMQLLQILYILKITGLELDKDKNRNSHIYIDYELKKLKKRGEWDTE